MTDIKRSSIRIKKRLTIENILVVLDIRGKGKRKHRSNLVNMDQIKRYQILIIDDIKWKKTKIKQFQQLNIKVFTYQQMRAEIEKHQIFGAIMNSEVRAVLADKNNVATLIVNNKIKACESLASLNHKYKLGIANIGSETWKQVKGERIENYVAPPAHPVYVKRLTFNARADDISSTTAEHIALNEALSLMYNVVIYTDSAVALQRVKQVQARVVTAK